MKDIFNGWLWQQVADGNPLGMALYERHYSCDTATLDRRRRRGSKLFAGPGEKIILLIPGNEPALFVWRRFFPIDSPDAKVIECAIFRNESPHLSSDLIIEAERIAAIRWPGETARTWINTTAVGGDGKCFKAAGWRKAGRSKRRNLLMLRKRLEQLPR